MQQASIDLLARLGAARHIEFRRDRLPSHCWLRTSDGLRLHYLDWPGGPETMLLLHGGALSAHTFDLLVLALAGGVRCLALDLRGHGLSDWADDYSIERRAADLIELVADRSLAAVHVAGMSLGGCVAGHAARAFGENLKSLTFIDVADEVNFTASARMRAFFDAVRPVQRVEDLVKQALTVSPKTDPDLMLYRYTHLLKRSRDGFTWRADRRRQSDFPETLRKLGELADHAPHISCPVLVVKGGRSRVLSRRRLERFAGRFPDGDWVIVPGAGHNVQEDEPVALAAALNGIMALVKAKEASGQAACRELPSEPAGG